MVGGINFGAADSSLQLIVVARASSYAKEQLNVIRVVLLIINIPPLTITIIIPRLPIVIATLPTLGENSHS